MSSSKRHFTTVIGNKEQGMYVSSSPSSAARKAVSKLCADDKKMKVEFSIRETTQGSNKKVYGPYIGYMQKLDKPIELKGRVIKYKPIAKLNKGKNLSNSKNLAVRGGIGNSNSYQLLEVDNFAGGGQVFQQPPPFERAIVSRIIKSAEEHGIFIPIYVIWNFAHEYASKYPHLLRKFHQSNVEEALSVFQQSYVPPQRPQNRQPPPPVRNNPFELVLEKRAISPDIIGYRKFAEFMDHHPPDGYMWAFRNCPSLLEVQKRMCFKNCGSLKNISVFIAGMLFYENGSIGFFKQSMSRTTDSPSHQFGMPVVLWPCRVGHYIRIPDIHYEGEKPSDINALYSKSGREYLGSSHVVGMIARADNAYSNSIIPRFANNIKDGEATGILANPDFYAACNDAMTKIGGIPVRIDATPTRHEASFAEEVEDNEHAADTSNWGAAAP